MSFIDVKNVTKIFGPDPQAALQRVKDGIGKDELLESGHTLGVDDVSLQIQRGEIFVVMGLSGSGKSTLIRHFNRLIEPTDGHILVDGLDVVELSQGDLVKFRRKTMSMVFQRFGLLPHRRVIDNVAYGLEIQGVAKSAREEKATEWLESVGLSGYEQSYPSQLSGGMQQRVGLARALCTDPDVLLMDEAFSALDPLIRSEMQDQLVDLQARLNKTIVFITHDLDEALRLGDHIAILKDGKLAQVGTPADILLHPADDYVRAFVRDVNRARVLSVENVMQRPVYRITHDNIETALADMRRLKTDYGYLSGDEHGYQGVVTLAALETALARKGQITSLADLAVETGAFKSSSTLEQVLPAALTSEHPLAILDGTGELAGCVGRNHISEVLTVDQRADAVDEPKVEAVPDPKREVA